ncbi:MULTISPECIES: 2OG-Fe(II) oxygenase [Pseudomonas]|uniref:2OG-Fe(II) oxygenase n=1 Tax=Pseudomonas TaxID=286 RepID=UPI000DA6E113|nr:MULTISPECIES: 2OG-Fe(II) oxygenase [Pseudomonas]MDW3713640.1 2OG-Fe(II) oxygenase [Pseudomonas sp. 2023EL-01195]PZE14984.1 proline hydroxylase [Pseudomonas sp. 57B-090624]
MNPLATLERAVPDPTLERIEQLDWQALEAELDANGSALIPHLLDDAACARLASLYSQEAGFRSRIVMERQGFGRGEYKYFAYPLPALLGRLRHRLYPPLAAIANRWNQRLGLDTRYPARLDGFLARCHRAGQHRPTPLLLQYGPGCYNRLHQDLYGEHVFPLQLAVLLSAPEQDFSGGEFVLTENIAGQQRADVVPLGKGDAVLFPVDLRPVPGKRGGFRRAAMRHGVSLIRSGERRTLGLIFHDAS